MNAATSSHWIAGSNQNAVRELLLEKRLHLHNVALCGPSTDQSSLSDTHAFTCHRTITGSWIRFLALASDTSGYWYWILRLTDVNVECVIWASVTQIKSTRKFRSKAKSRRIMETLRPSSELLRAWKLFDQHPPPAPDLPSIQKNNFNSQKHLFFWSRASHSICHEPTSSMYYLWVICFDDLYSASFRVEWKGTALSHKENFVYKSSDMAGS